ncbi:MAG: serine/threonine-protein kinase [Polyangiaceae bacterium]
MTPEGERFEDTLSASSTSSSAAKDARRAGPTLELGEGAAFASDFRIVRPLTAGGMGAVYVARQESTQKLRALKLMHPQLVADKKMRDRFEQEAKIVSLIKSDHVVEVIGAGVDVATGIPYLAMELLEGQDLYAYVAGHGPVPPSELVSIFEQVGHALSAAHAAGIIHRDLKPENIFLTRSQGVTATRVVKLLDFGIAKILAQATMPTSILGTPLWMAPEQTDPRAEITVRTDVWSLGLIAFWLLTGREFWASVHLPGVSVQAVMRELLFEPIPPASERAHELGCEVELPRGFDGWFRRCVHRDASARFESVEAMLARLRSVTAGEVEVSEASEVARDLVSKRDERSAAGITARTARESLETRARPSIALVALATAGFALLGAFVLAWALGLVDLGPRNRSARSSTIAQVESSAAPSSLVTPTAVSTPLVVVARPVQSEAPAPMRSVSPIVSARVHASTKPRNLPAPVASVATPARAFNYDEANAIINNHKRLAEEGCFGRPGPPAISVVINYDNNGFPNVSMDVEARVSDAGSCVWSYMMGAKVSAYDGPPVSLSTAVSIR